MASKTTIVLSANPRGMFLEGIISGTPKPGTLMQLKAATEPVQGRPTWEVYNPAIGGDGVPGLVAVLREDDLNGKTVNDAYVSGTRCFLYCPIQGDEINVRKADISGTGTASEDVAIAAKLLIVAGTGMVSAVAVGVIASPVAYPFQALETITDWPAEGLIQVMYTGR